jgi:sulfur relay (sulfurtransferase) DsrC/TusE family protein
MINLVKSQPAPACLVVEKAKRSGDYNCSDVLIRLKTDSHNKCYLCEDKGFTSINIEHFIAHQGNLDLKFDWNNLFYVCGHCNNTKLAQYQRLLNCTNSTIKITDVIKFRGYGMPKEHFEISATEAQPSVETTNTVALLNAIYSGTTKNKEIASENLRDKVSKELAAFTQYLREFYLEIGLTPIEKQTLITQIRRRLSPESPFTAFKIWMVKSNDRYMRDFGEFLN